MPDPLDDEVWRIRLAMHCSEKMLPILQTDARRWAVATGPVLASDVALTLECLVGMIMTIHARLARLEALIEIRHA